MTAMVGGDDPGEEHQGPLTRSMVDVALSPRVRAGANDRRANIMQDHCVGFMLAAGA